jgi:acetyl esterase
MHDLIDTLKILAETLPPLDPGMRAFGEKITAATPPEAVHWPLETQRQAWDEVCRSFRAPHPPGLSVSDVAIPGPGSGLTLRLYRPPGEGPKPGLLYFHGGGWILGGLDTHDDMCAEIAAGADVVVIALDYRLAPENPHPAQYDDSRAALDWVLAQGEAHGIDTRRLIAGGDSAGGQMTAGLALALRDEGRHDLKGQVLIYPVLDHDMGTASYRVNAQASSLSRDEMVHYLEAFLGKPGSPAWRDKRAVPLLEIDYKNLPPAFVTAAGHDPLHDEAMIYAARLADAGVAVAVRREPALGHSYMRARRVSEPAGAAFDAIVAAIRLLAHEGRVPAA